MLELTGVTAGYGRHQVLVDIDFSLHEPGLYLALGENGSGKSTLLKVASGRLRPMQGEVRLGSVRLYRLFGADIPFHEFVSFGAVPDSDATLLEMYRLKLDATGRAGRLGDFLQTYDVPWSAAQFSRLHQGALSTSEVSELHLLLALATSPRFLFVDEVFSQWGREVTQRMVANLQRWGNRTEGLALIASTRFAGYMDAFKDCFVLSEGKLSSLPGSREEAASLVALADDATGARAAYAPGEREVTFGFGDFFYRHQRIALDNPHFELKAVLENALLVRLKSTLDGALAYLHELGLDPVRIEFVRPSSEEASEEPTGSSENAAS